MTTTKLDFRSTKCDVGFKYTPKNKLYEKFKNEFSYYP